MILQAELSDEQAIARVLGELKTDWQLVHNRRELMIVPPGVSKASGLAAVLQDYRILPEQVAAIGDAENDRPLRR